MGKQPDPLIQAWRDWTISLTDPEHNAMGTGLIARDAFAAGWDAAVAAFAADIEGLRALSEAATPGPWKQTGTEAKPHWYVAAPDCLVHGPAMDATDMAPATYDRWNADAALIVAAVNLVRALLHTVASEPRPTGGTE